MALRLYPQIRFSHPDAPLIESLAGGPAGKFTRVEELKAKYPDRQKGRAIGYKAISRYFAEVFAGAYLDQMSAFLWYAGGQLTRHAQGIIRTRCPETLVGRQVYANTINRERTNPLRVNVQGVDLRGVDLDEFGGVA